MTYYAVERPEGETFVAVMIGVMRPKPVRTGDLEYACAIAMGYEGARIVRVDPGKRTVLGKDAIGRWVDPKAR